MRSVSSSCDFPAEASPIEARRRRGREERPPRSEFALRSVRAEDFLVVPTGAMLFRVATFFPAGDHASGERFPREKTASQRAMSSHHQLCAEQARKTRKCAILYCSIYAMESSNCCFFKSAFDGASYQVLANDIAQKSVAFIHAVTSFSSLSIFGKIRPREGNFLFIIIYFLYYILRFSLSR